MEGIGTTISSNKSKIKSGESAVTSTDRLDQ